MSKTVYKIRRKSDGLFSTGGCWPTFKANGKAWSTKGALNGHLSQNPKYVDCEIVEYALVQTEVGTAVDVDSYQDERRRIADSKKGNTRTRIPKCPTCNQPVSACSGRDDPHGSISIHRAY